MTPLTSSTIPCGPGNLGIADTSVKTRGDASDAIAATADALKIVSAQRSLFGAYENRFDHARANVTNTAENVQASESRIRDTDMAEEMVAYSTSQILMQAGEAILAQQNSSMSQILSAAAVIVTFQASTTSTAELFYQLKEA